MIYASGMVCVFRGGHVRRKREEREVNGVLRFLGEGKLSAGCGTLGRVCLMWGMVV